MSTPIELTANIIAAMVTAQDYGQKVSSHELVEDMRIIYNALADMARAEGVAGRRIEFGNPLDSIGRNEVTCLDCGQSFKLLSNKHLARHGLTPRSYKKKHGIPLCQPLSAQSLTARRRKLAKENGMGGPLAEWRAAKRLASVS